MTGQVPPEKSRVTRIGRPLEWVFSILGGSIASLSRFYSLYPLFTTWGDLSGSLPFPAIYF
jgi:hypothetical protein